jgi:hypothetical protein
MSYSPTAVEQVAYEQKQISMFGCVKAEIDRADAEALGHPMMRIMGLISDAQQEMAMGMTEKSRQTLNIAKYLISKHGFHNLEVAA